MDLGPFKNLCFILHGLRPRALKLSLDFGLFKIWGCLDLGLFKIGG